MYILMETFVQGSAGSDLLTWQEFLIYGAAMIIV